MDMLTLILAESELELIPESLVKDSRILASAGRRGKHPGEMILDSSMHHGAMHRLPEYERRGRPDITHLFLLVSLESIVNKQGGLRVMIHTRNDEVIMVDSETRIIKNYDRFLGLMEQLFQKTVIPDKEQPLLRLRKKVPLLRLLEETPGDVHIVCSTEGEPVRLPQYFSGLKEKSKQDVVCVIGGFPKGDFHTVFTDTVDACISIYPEMVPAWTVANELLVNYENIFFV
ncbi:MAG: 16S rRNA methyltransferase [Methanobacteriota archaeon]